MKTTPQMRHAIQRLSESIEAIHRFDYDDFSLEGGIRLLSLKTIELVAATTVAFGNLQSAISAISDAINAAVEDYPENERN